MLVRIQPNPLMELTKRVYDPPVQDCLDNHVAFWDVEWISPTSHGMGCGKCNWTLKFTNKGVEVVGDVTRL